ncbi:MAG: hypothetical protein M3Y71_02230 [Actinomycetota bacterium]|nr:hypothetical protein [Actinomycetota bacterium]
MLVVGVILLVIGLGGGALLAYLAAQSDQAVSLTAGAVSVGLAPLALFLAGALAMVLVWLGARLGVVGVRHQRQQRRALKRQRLRVEGLQATADAVDPNSKGPAGPTTTGPGSTPPAS